MVSGAARCGWGRTSPSSPTVAVAATVAVVAIAAALFVAAAAEPTPPHAPPAVGLDVALPLGDGVYNPSMAVHAGHAYVVARATRLRWDTSGLKWIVNRAYLCGFPLQGGGAAAGGGGGGNGGGESESGGGGGGHLDAPLSASSVNASSRALPPSLAWVAQAEAEQMLLDEEEEAQADEGAAVAAPRPPPRRRCAPLDPWAPSSLPSPSSPASSPSSLSSSSSPPTYDECRPSPPRRDPWDATGVDDTKVFAWPGRGLWAITGRRPPAPRAAAAASSSPPPRRRRRSTLAAAAADADAADTNEGGGGDNRWPPGRRCPQPVVWRQFLFRLAPEGEPADLAALSDAGRTTGRRRRRRRQRGPSGNGNGGDLRGPPPLPDTGGVAWAPDPPSYHPFGVSEGWWPSDGGGGRAGAEEPRSAGAAFWAERARERGRGRAGGGGGGSSSEYRPMFEPLRPGQEGQQTRAWQQRRHGRRRADGGGGSNSAGGKRRRRRHRRPAAALAAAARSAAAGGGGDAAGEEERRWAWEVAARAPPLELALADAFAVYGRGYDLYEKNWMPLALPPLEEEEGEGGEERASGERGGGGGGERRRRPPAARPRPLFVVHSLHPYRVYELAPNGTALPLAAGPESEAARGRQLEATRRALRDALAPAPSADADADANAAAAAAAAPDAEAEADALLPRVHGGPPLIHYAPRRGPPRLLGVLHYWLPRPAGGGGGGGRTYHHRLFFAAAAPPFSVERVARRELPLRAPAAAAAAAAAAARGGAGLGGARGRGRAESRAGGYAAVAFASGLHHDRAAAAWPPPSSSAAADGAAGGGGGGGESAGAVVVTYGSGDAAARALVLSEDEVEAMF